MALLSQLILCALLLYIGWRVLRWRTTRSPLDNIPGPKSESYISGNLSLFWHRQKAWSYREGLTEQYGRIFTVHGLLNAKSLYTFDPRALHTIFVKELDIFDESAMFMSAAELYLGPGLLATLGDHHRRQRKMLNPVFSARHLRDMAPLFNGVIHRLEEAISHRVKDGPQEVDMLGWMGRAALELIGQGGLGHSFDPLTEDVADEFADALKAYFPVQTELPLLFRQLIPFFVKMGPARFRRKVVELLPNAAVQRMRQITDAMHASSLRIIADKKAALEQGDEALKLRVGEGKDIMSVLLRENMSAAKEDRLSDEELVAQVTTLVLAAMDTTSGALARTLHMLSMHPDVQEKLREELLQARDNGTGELRDLDYDEVMELPYLDIVCRETLRKYPPVPILNRVVRQDVVLPISAPIRGCDGALVDNIPLEKGLEIIVDLTASNCSKDTWGEDADEWRPERWLEPLPRAVEEARIPGIYSHLMTFIGGGRSCIGFNFSQLEMKAVLATLIPAFKFELPEKPIVWNSAGVSYPTVGDGLKSEMPLRVTRINV